MILQERDLEFDFTGAERVYKLDEQGPQQLAPQGLKLVDFVVREADRTLLVEVKDPSDSESTPKDRKFYARRMCNHELIDNELVPKIRDSYTYLHLMAEDDLPFVCVAVLGFDRLPGIRSPELLMLQDRLRGRVRQETATPWKRPYVEDAVVCSSENWNDYFPYPVRRFRGPKRTR